MPLVRVCIQKFPDWVDNEIYTYNYKHSLRSNTKGYGGRTHYTDSQNSDTTAFSGRELYHLPFSLQAVSPYAFVTWWFKHNGNFTYALTTKNMKLLIGIIKKRQLLWSIFHTLKIKNMSPMRDFECVWQSSSIEILCVYQVTCAEIK
jgi:hypothetical protein